MTRSRPPITPLSLPADVRTLVVFGGSFDPPHVYHTVAPLTVLKRVCGKSAWLLYVPAAQSPLKKRGPIASDGHRLAMLRRALDIPALCSIWTDEIDRAAWLKSRRRCEPSFTIDTLHRLRKVIPARVKLRLLIGADQAADFHRWKHAREIVTLAEPIVMAREPIVTTSSLFSALDQTFWSRADRVAWCSRLAPNVPLPAASTKLRDAIPGAPRNVELWTKRKGLDCITSSVAQYIVDHNLYSFRPGSAKLADAAVERSREIDGDGAMGKGVPARAPGQAVKFLLDVLKPTSRDRPARRAPRAAPRSNAPRKKPASRRKRA